MIKNICIALACTVLFQYQTSSLNAREPDKNLAIYLLIGQSNMAGRATVTDAVRDTLEQVFLFRDDASGIVWEKAANPLNKYSTIRKELSMQKLGMGYSFAKKMVEHDPESSLGLVVNARGGTEIASWLPGQEYYKEAVKRAKAAMEWGEIKGILWHQGESDAEASDHMERINNYVTDLSVMIQELRKELGNEQLPVVVGEIYPNPKLPAKALFNEFLADAPNVIPFLRVVSSTSTATSDNVHFNTGSQLLMGERYAQAMIELRETTSSMAGSVVHDKLISDQAWYDLMGKQLPASSAKGMVIKRNRYEDGTVSFEKVYIK